MIHPFLEVAAMEWLRYSRMCHIVIMERGVGSGRPDVIAVNAKGYMCEVEVKRTMSDFRRDARKPHRIDPEKRAKHVRQLYYMVPPELADKVLAELPEACGLMTTSHIISLHSQIPEAKVIKPAPPRSWAKPLSDKVKWSLVRDMAAHVVTAETTARKLKLAIRSKLA